MDAGAGPAVRCVLTLTIQTSLVCAEDSIVGHVTHGTDRPLWMFRLPTLEPDQVPVARAWQDAVDVETKRLESGEAGRGLKEVLTLTEERTIAWREDKRWDEVMRLLDALPGET
jgi:hypothetical protein